MVTSPPIVSEHASDRKPASRDEIAAVLAIPEEGDRGMALVELFQRMPVGLLPDALAAARALPQNFWRALALTELVARLPESEREAASRDALSAVLTISDETAQAALLAALAPYLSDAMLTAAFAATQATVNESVKAAFLAALGHHLPEVLLPEAHATASGISDEYHRSQALAALPRLPEPSPPEPPPSKKTTSGEPAIRLVPDAPLQDSWRATIRPQFFLTRVVGGEDEPDVEILTLAVLPSFEGVKGIEQIEQEVMYGEEFETTAGSSVDFDPDACLSALNQVIIDAGVREGLLWKPERYKAYANDIFQSVPVPVVNSAMGSSTLVSLAAAQGGGAAFMAVFPTDGGVRITIYFLVMGRTLIVMGAADGVSIALKQGLSDMLLKLMGVPAATASARKRKKGMPNKFEAGRRGLRGA